MGGSEPLVMYTVLLALSNKLLVTPVNHALSDSLPLSVGGTRGLVLTNKAQQNDRMSPSLLGYLVWQRGLDVAPVMTAMLCKTLS